MKNGATTGAMIVGTLRRTTRWKMAIRGRGKFIGVGHKTSSCGSATLTPFHVYEFSERARGFITCNCGGQKFIKFMPSASNMQNR